MKHEDAATRKVCWECGYECQQDARYCPRCGTLVETCSSMPALYSSGSSGFSSMDDNVSQRQKQDKVSEFPNLNESPTQTAKQQSREQNFPSGQNLANDGKKQSVSSSKGDWNCKHCTFLNPPTTSVCGVCYKTSWVNEENDDMDSPVFEVKCFTISKMYCYYKYLCSAWGLCIAADSYFGLHYADHYVKHTFAGQHGCSKDERQGVLMEKRLISI